jgi:hypothetical protein
VALLSVHVCVCAVALFGFIVLKNTTHLVLIIYFMNKNYGSNLRLIVN